jgi:hypothetical protein
MMDLLDQFEEETNMNKNTTQREIILTSKIKGVLLTLCIMGLTSITSFAQETIEGPLKFLKAENGETFLAIDSTKKLVTKGDDGSLLESKLIQIAGLDENNWRQALQLVGKNVTASGKPMGALTQHHFTPVLLITDKITEQTTPVLREEPTETPELEGGENRTSSENNFSREW